MFSKYIPLPAVLSSLTVAPMGTGANPRFVFLLNLPLFFTDARSFCLRHGVCRSNYQEHLRSGGGYMQNVIPCGRWVWTASFLTFFFFSGTRVLQDVDRRLSEGEKDHFLPVRNGREALCTVSLCLPYVGCR